jgi:hypothetical protein
MEIAKLVMATSKLIIDAANKAGIVVYPNTETLIKVCKSFEGKQLRVYAEFMGKNIPITNCNAVGDILENVVYPIIKDELPDFEEGPPQAPPDYFGMNKTFQFEQKTFMKNPGFDIGNFTSYVNQLCEAGGVYKKLFQTKYLVFEYTINEKDKTIDIIKFHYLNVYNLVGYSGKYPINMQVKKKMWYNIRPDSVKKWYCPQKTPQLFIDQLIKCIEDCPHLDEKESKIKTISQQFNELKSIYTF